MNPIASEYIVKQHTNEIREYASAINRAQKQKKHRNSNRRIRWRVSQSISVILDKLSLLSFIRHA